MHTLNLLYQCQTILYVKGHCLLVKELNLYAIFILYRFSSVAKEVLAHRIPSKAYDCYMLLCDSVQMLYSPQLQATGWQDHHIARLEKLLWSHAIRAEEFYGLHMCTKNLEYSVHVAEDIRRHSSMDNYSCELYERAILKHKAQKHNAKGLEKTFAVRENMRNFLDDYQERNGPLSQYGINDKKYQFDLQEITLPIMLQESSFGAAKSLIQDMLQLPNPSPEVQHAVSYGVPVGRMDRMVFSDAIIADIIRFFRRFGLPVEDIPNVLKSITHLAIRDVVGNIEKVSRGTVCKIGSADEDWIMEVSDIFHIGPVDCKHFIFVNGKYFIPTLNNGNVIHHTWTQTPQLIPRGYVRDSVQPTCYIKRKVMMYPDPSNLDNPSFYLCIDFKNPELVKEVTVPVYPQQNETVCILGEDNEDWFGLVQQVDNEARTAVVKWYTETRRPGVWVLMNQEDQVYFASVMRTCQVNRIFGGYSIT